MLLRGEAGAGWQKAGKAPELDSVHGWGASLECCTGHDAGASGGEKPGACGHLDQDWGPEKVVVPRGSRMQRPGLEGASGPSAIYEVKLMDVEPRACDWAILRPDGAGGKLGRGCHG